MHVCSGGRVFVYLEKCEIYAIFAPENVKRIMELKVERRWKKAEYVIGRLYINDVLQCNTLEDTDRGLDDKMADWMIRNKKIPTRTAIPTGRYRVNMDTVSPKFSRYPFYMQVCQGKLPRLENVKGFSGILIHCGSDQTMTDGCLLVGLNRTKGKLTDCKEVFQKLYNQMIAAHRRGEEIWIDIQ